MKIYSISNSLPLDMEKKRNKTRKQTAFKVFNPFNNNLVQFPLLYLTKSKRVYHLLYSLNRYCKYCLSELAFFERDIIHQDDKEDISRL